MGLGPTVAQWIELSRQYQQNPNGPRVLPIAKVGESYYFVDERTRQLRNVAMPEDFMDFETQGDMLVFIGRFGEIVS